MDTKKTLFKEHRRLVKLLRYGNRRQLLKEARIQEKELKAYQKGY